MGTWHAPEEGNKDRKLQQETQQSGGDAAVARSSIEGLSNKGLQGVVPGLTVQLKGMGGAVLDDTIARAIHSKRGSGEQLDPGVADSMGKSMGHDFSGVNIHRDSEADKLNKDVQAEAFTTGQDVFFREGKYDPVSNEGQKLLAHELTHVAQQEGAPASSELRVSDPGDASEQQASSVADTVTSSAGGGGGAAASVGRAEDEEVATQAAKNPEEEKENAPYGKTNMNMSVERQEGGEAEEEEAATMVARQEGGEAEEEEAATMVARQEGGEAEEEEAATMVARQEGGEAEEEEAATMVMRDHAEEEEGAPGHAM